MKEHSSLFQFRHLRDAAARANGGLWVWSENRAFIETFSPEVVRALLAVAEAADEYSRAVLAGTDEKLRVLGLGEIVGRRVYVVWTCPDCGSQVELMPDDGEGLAPRWVCSYEFHHGQPKTYLLDPVRKECVC